MLAAAKISSRAVAQKGIVGHAATSLVSAVGTSVTCAACSCPTPSCRCSSQRRHADPSAITSTTTARSYSSSSTAPAPADTIASIEQSFPGAVPNSTLLATLQSRLGPHGYKSSNTLVATSLCADEVNRTLEKDLADAYDMPNFNMGGLAGFPFGGVTAFGAMASHIPDGGHTLVVYAPHVGVDSTGAVGTVERVGRAKGGACCGSAIAASAYVSNIHSGAAAKYGPLGDASESICQKFFHSVDGNQDGSIDKAECSALLAKLNISLSAAEMETLYSELDTSGDGQISQSEFSAWFGRSKPTDANPQDAGAHQAKLTVDPTDAQQSFVGTMLLPHAERLEAADNKMVELPFALFDAQKGLMDHIVSAGAANVAGKGKIAVLGGIQINTPNEGDDAMEDYFLPLSMEVYDHRGNVIFDDNDHP